MPTPIIFLTDNGSLRPEATLQLRNLADQLSERTAHKVEAVSLLHSHKIPAGALSGRPATIVKRRIRELAREGQRDFVVLPLFLGPSLAITDYLPQVVSELAQEIPGLKVRIAAPLAGSSVAEPEPRLAVMLREQLDQTGVLNSGDQVALVDHGTPIRVVNELRNAVARQLACGLLRPVEACSMERREGPEYAFNEPLLEQLPSAPGSGEGRLFLAMFFLLPGRHAGPSGDVAEIAGGLIERGAFRDVLMSPLLGEHPAILDILSDRLRAVVGG
ncbi:MAG: sirohydrochlorin chelatase [Opitutales bacterium]